jgi:hypothetical protein
MNRRFHVMCTDIYTHIHLSVCLSVYHGSHENETWWDLVWGCPKGNVWPGPIPTFISSLSSPTSRCWVPHHFCRGGWFPLCKQRLTSLSGPNCSHITISTLFRKLAFLGHLPLDTTELSSILSRNKCLQSCVLLQFCSPSQLQIYFPVFLDLIFKMITWVLSMSWVFLF